MVEDGDKPYAVVVLSKGTNQLDVIIQGYTNEIDLRVGYLKLYTRALEKGMVKPVPVERINGHGFKVLTDLVITLDK